MVITTDPPPKAENTVKTVSLVRFTSQIDIQSSFYVVNVSKDSITNPFALIAQQAENYTLVMNTVLGVFQDTPTVPLNIIAVAATDDTRLTLKLIQVFVKAKEDASLRLFRTGLSSASVIAISVTSCARIEGATDVSVLYDSELCSLSNT